MKKRLPLFLLLVCGFAYAQQHIDTGVASQTNTVISLLEKNRVPNGLLLDYGYDFVSVPNYDGVLRSTNYITPSIYRDLYNSILSSRTTTTVPELVIPDDLESVWKGKQKSETNRVGKGGPTSAVVLNGLYYKYSRFRSDALSTNRIQIVDGKYDDVYVSGTWQNPYETKEAFAISMPVRKVINSQISVLLHNDTWLTNQASTVQSFSIDFGDGGGYVSLTLGTPLNHTYSSDGTYTITYRMRLTNGQYRYCRNKLEVTGAERQNSLTARNPSCAIRTVSVSGTRSYLGSTGSATLQIAYAGTCNQISNPLIVVEGFDTGFINQGQFGDTELGNFLDYAANSNSVNLRNLITTNTSYDYDIIYVNWDDGTDYLQRNAYLLEDVINWVNNNKIGSTPNVVLGQSMGGVIARYALRDMENRSMDHETSLYISQDAPHQGAHVPPGFLFMARHALNELITTPVGGIGISMAGGDVPVQDARQLIDRPAVRQLLKNYVNSSYTIDNSEHNAWQTALRSMGYPQQTRNIALSNASHCAMTQGFSSNEIMFSLNGSAATSPFTDLVVFFTGLGFAPGALLGDLQAALLGFLPGNSKLTADFEVRTFPSTGSATVYKGKLTYKKTLLWLVPITRTITDLTKSANSGGLFMDNYPGGVNPFSIDNSSDYVTNFFAGYNYNLYANLNFNFIPAPSALDVGSGNTTLVALDYTRTYTKSNPPTGSKTIPFANFATSLDDTGNNQSHLFFEKRNGDWLAEELDNDTSVDIFNCSLACGNFSITGPSIPCSNGSSYSISGLPSGTGITWTSSSNITRNSSQGANPATFSLSGTGSTGWIQASIAQPSSCGSPIVIRKNLTLTSGSVNLTIDTVEGEGSAIYVSGHVTGGSAPYKWYINNQLIATTSSSFFSHRYPCDGGGSVLGVVTSCGGSDTASYYEDCSGSGGHRMAVYPNPATTEIFISPLEMGSGQIQGSGGNAQLANSMGNELDPMVLENVELKLLDFSGNVVSEKKFTGLHENLQLDVSAFPKGIYYLKIIGKGIDETHPILID